MEKWEERESVVLANEGQKLFAIVHRPLHRSSYPMVLVCHGLGGHKTGKYRLYVHLAEMLTKKGIGCMRVDFRGSGDSEGAFSEMSVESEISDAMVSLDYLKKDLRVDLSRIGLFGRSFGGLIALSAARQFQQVKSLALWAPIFNGDQWRDAWKLLQADLLPEEHKEKLMRFNGLMPSHEFFGQLFSFEMEPVLSSLNKLPLLHIHGERDEIIHLSHADKYKEMRKDAPGQTKFLRLGKSDHDFSCPAEQKIALNETAAWFEKTLN